MRENFFRLLVREYAAILCQQAGLRAFARSLRSLRSRHRIKAHAPAPATPAGPHVEDAQPADIGRPVGEMTPFIVDTDTERTLQFSPEALQSRMRLDDPFALLATYTRQMMSFLLFNPDPDRVLLIGLGGGSMQKFCYRHLPHLRTTTVEIDARVIALRDAFHVPPDDDRLRIVHDDGAGYIARLEQPVDAILIDAFDEAGVAQSLATAAFFRDASRHLAPDGVLVMNLHGDPARYAGHLRCAQSAFPARTWLAAVTNNENRLLFAFGADAPSPQSPVLDLRARYLQARLKLPFRAYVQRLREGHALQSFTSSVMLTGQ